MTEQTSDTQTPVAEQTAEQAPAQAVNATSFEGRYSVADDGQIMWQENSSNPLPGVAVGRLTKGSEMLKPQADAAGHPRAQEWLDIHVRSVLEPLFALMQTEGAGALTAAAHDIGQRLYEHLGVVHRSDLEDIIPALTPDLRKELRAKGVRLGPVLAFLPALVKPAAIRMRALLWGIWNGKALPVAKPADGRVSETVDPATIDRGFYRMIGYPVFGPRAIRIDMLDRVVTDIYDTAQQGVFEAKHKYAEWFGCGLDDLHAVLESMGHRKLKDETAPAVAVPEAVAPEVVAAVAVEAPAAEAIADATPVPETLATVVAAPKAPPVVVKFMLKRGKMSDRPAQRHARPHHKKPHQQAEGDAAAPAAAEGSERRRERGERPERKDFTAKKAYDPNRPNPKRERDGNGDERPRKPKFDRDKDRDREARVYTFEGKPTADDDDKNPFAILKKLKT